MKEERTKIIAIAGPTGSGKTEYAIKLAKTINGELINCDSRQVYIGMDIGTNKGLIEKTNEFIEFEGKKLNAFNIERSNIYGWLFDILKPDEQVNLAQYQRLTNLIINKIIEKGKVPILIGGTGLYLDSMAKGYELDNIEPDIKLRLKLSLLSTNDLFKKLLIVDEERAKNLNNSDAKNPRRLIRAIEQAIGRRKLEKEKPENSKHNVLPKHDLYIIYPDLDREKLYEKIDARVLEMVASGLVEETKRVIEEYNKDLEVLKGIGYKEVIEYLDNKITLSEMIAKIQQGHKNYAKRQTTWFEGKGRGYELHKYNFALQEENVIEQIKEFLKSPTLY